MNETVLLTTEEVATELRVSIKTVQRLVREGLLPHFNLGYRTKRISKEDLDAFKAKCAVTPYGC